MLPVIVSKRASHIRSWVRFFAQRCGLAILCVLITGCSMMPHALQPSQLRKLNRTQEMGRDTTHFSIPDPLPKKQTEAEGMMDGDPFQ